MHRPIPREQPGPFEKVPGPPSSGLLNKWRSLIGSMSCQAWLPHACSEQGANIGGRRLYISFIKWLLSTAFFLSIVKWINSSRISIWHKNSCLLYWGQNFFQPMFSPACVSANYGNTRMSRQKNRRSLVVEPSALVIPPGVSGYLQQWKLRIVILRSKCTDILINLHGFPNNLIF